MLISNAHGGGLIPPAFTNLLMSISSGVVYCHRLVDCYFSSHTMHDPVLLNLLEHFVIDKKILHVPSNVSRYMLSEENYNSAVAV